MIPRNSVTRRLLLLGLLTYLLLFLGLAALNSALVALAIPLVLYMGAALLFGPSSLNLKVTRSLSAERVAKGTPVEVRLQVSNEGSQLEELLLEDVLPAGLEQVEGKGFRLTTLSPGETIDLQYTVRGGRGSYLFREVRALASDQLGLFRRRILLSAHAHLLILPEYTRLRTVPIRPRRTHAFTGPIPSRLGGSGVSFFGVREYQFGDSMRHLNWRVTARHAEELFTNDYEQERIADVGLILDARQGTDVPCPQGSLFEHAVFATASLADVFLRGGNRVGLLVYGRGRETTFPGYGKIQRERILHALAAARTGDNMALEHLDYLPTRFFPAHSQLVLVSPLIPDDLPVLVRLRANGYSLLVVSPDPVTFEARMLDDSPDLELAVRIARLERVLLIRKLQRVGIHVVDWQVERSLDRVMYAALGKTPPAPV
jgi:uncharacterized protein (DUF58 family)